MFKAACAGQIRSNEIAKWNFRCGGGRDSRDKGVWKRTFVIACGYVFVGGHASFGEERTFFFFLAREGKKELKISLSSANYARVTWRVSEREERTPVFSFFFLERILPPPLLSSFFAQPGAKRITSNPLLKASRRATISIARGLTSRSEMSDPFRVDYRAIDRGFATFRAARSSRWRNELFPSIILVIFRSKICLRKMENVRVTRKEWRNWPMKTINVDFVSKFSTFHCIVI